MDEWVKDERNDEIWLDTETYSSREAAIAAGRKEYDGDFYIGKVGRFEPRVDANNVIEQLRQEAFDECGDVSDNWLDFMFDSAEVENLQKRLQSAFDEWLEIVGDKPAFYAIRETELIGGDSGE